MAQLKAVIIGCGAIAGGYDRPAGPQIMTHAKAYKSTPGVILAACCDASRAKVRTFQEKWKIPAGFKDVRQMLKAIKPDIVSICTPSPTHAKLIRLISRYPVRAILCEKPLAEDSNESRRLVELCRKKKKVLAVNYFRRWNGEIQQIGQAIRSNRWGRVQNVRVMYSKGVFHNASHFVNLMQEWFGKMTGVQAVASRSWKGKDLAGDFICRHERMERIYYQYCPEKNYESFEIDMWFEKGRVELLRGGREIRFTRVEAHPQLAGESILSSKAVLKKDVFIHSTLLVVENVVRAVKGDEKLVMPAIEAVETVMICEQMERAARHAR